METFSFTNVNFIVIGIFVGVVFIIIALQVKNRIASKFLHYIKTKFGKYSQP